MRITSTWRSASRSERRHGILLGSLLGTLSLAVALGTARAQGAVVGQVHVMDRPGETTHDLGDAVVWLEAPGRTAFPASANAALSSATILGLYRHGQSKAAPFERPGIYPIYCNIHHRMVSFVVAVPTSWAGQPQDDGRFALHDVPPGRYVLHAWHERAGEVHQNVEVREGAPVSVDLALDARGYVPTPHPNKFGLPYTPTRADRY